MAKVTGPLFSIEARGKIADAMVHFPWKGLNVVRGWVMPANKKSADQGDVRLMIGGLGRAMSDVEKNSAYQMDLLDLAEGSETWNSAYVKYVMLNIFTNAAAYEVEHTAYVGHKSKTVFDAQAAADGLLDFDVSYKGTTNKFEGGFQYYILGRAAISIHALHSDLFNRAPYSVALVDWVNTQINALRDDLDEA
jgi:hypothetical protein